MKQIFDHPVSGKEAAKRLFSLRQGSRSVAEFAIEFRTLAAESGWNDEALHGAFLNALSDTLKDEMASRDVPCDLSDLIDLAIRVDNRLRERRRERSGKAPSSLRSFSSPSTSSSTAFPALPPPPLQSSVEPEPMQLGRARLDAEERQRRMNSRSCLYCVLIDSGADESFLDQEIIQQLGIKTQPLDTPLEAKALNGQVLARVTEKTLPVFLHLSDPPDLSAVPSVYHDLGAVFSKHHALSLPPHRPYDCPIDLLPGAPLPCSRLYNLSRPENEAMEKYIQESLAAGIIRPSSSPVGAGFFFVDKKDKSLRPCIDYRGLNKITVKNKYPLPLISSAFTPLCGSTVFTKLDLRNAYHLVRIREGDEWKTAFNTPLGHFEYLVMPFGLTNAPAVFQNLVNDVLRDMIGRYVFVYIDDILIFSKDLETHKLHVRKVLQRLLENKLFVKAEKCQFHAPSVSFLGYIIAQGKVQMDPEKLTAVREWPSPTSRKELQRFLGFANFYRRFIRNFSRVAAPLTALTSTSHPFVWTQEAEAAFKELKLRFTSAPVLVQPNPDLQFVVEVDASDSGVGAVLSQHSSSDQKLHPCAYFSRKLSSAERNYDIGNRELLAIKLALEEWRHWLEGAIHPFIVWSDHKNLTYLQSAKRLNSRQARWALFFDRFNFTLTYRPGSKNLKPDALSRVFSADNPAPECDPILPQSCIVAAVTWEIESRVRLAQQNEPDPGTGPLNSLFVPNAVRSDVLQWAHSTNLTCHPGVNRTLAVLQSKFWWPTMDRDTRDFISACSVCSQTRHRTGLLLVFCGRYHSQSSLAYNTDAVPNIEHLGLWSACHFAPPISLYG
ncbi:hypothetical protein WMY93_008021 [Mugilogobius chulae]|uniref:Gypsy retrotransposon integrase-like protein 1 n=1 Tax=Mugilogobius chulae TaxID=88201 RepID=A0AAW0PEX2_9GOBI